MLSVSYLRHKDPPRCASGLKGVIHFRRGANCYWKVYGRHHGQYVTIGYFDTKEEAGAAYNDWARKVKGPGTYLNPISSSPHP